jgi:hypothetical protein
MDQLKHKYMDPSAYKAGYDDAPDKSAILDIIADTTRADLFGSESDEIMMEVSARRQVYSVAAHWTAEECMEMVGQIASILTTEVQSENFQCTTDKTRTVLRLVQLMLWLTNMTNEPSDDDLGGDTEEEEEDPDYQNTESSMDWPESSNQLQIQQSAEAKDSH